MTFAALCAPAATACEPRKPVFTGFGSLFVTKSGDIPKRWGFINTQAEKPALVHVVLNLLDQLPFAANTEEDLQQQGSQ
jgi:hypothetical protein